MSKFCQVVLLFGVAVTAVDAARCPFVTGAAIEKPLGSGLSGFEFIGVEHSNMKIARLTGPAKLRITKYSATPTFRTDGGRMLVEMPSACVTPTGTPTLTGYITSLQRDTSGSSRLRVAPIYGAAILAPFVGRGHGISAALVSMAIAGLALSPGTDATSHIACESALEVEIYMPDRKYLIKPPVGKGDNNGNICQGKKPAGPDFANTACMKNGVADVLEQAGTNVTVGYKGDIDASASPARTPITTPFFEAGLCTVNVHYHVGAEHLSVGQYDKEGKGPVDAHVTTAHGVHHEDHGASDPHGETVRMGQRCHLYDKTKEMFTKPYDFKFCKDMVVGQTYEVHWPSSAAGACGTPNQYQTPFYDGVFCRDGIISADAATLNTYSKIGVQAQVFTVVNDEKYYYPDLFRGMIVDGDMGQEITKYTGSTTGTSRNNEICSMYTPITWQVDRKCHLISASSFDKMCADQLSQRDNMEGDTHPHGARELVTDQLAANDHHNRRRDDDIRKVASDFHF